MLFRVDGHPVRDLLGDGLLGVNRWLVRCRGGGVAHTPYAYPSPMSTKPMPAIPDAHAYPTAICPAPSSPSQRATRYNPNLCTNLVR
jgi:hypothetical protein